MEIKDDTLKILVKDASASQRKQLKMIIGLVTTLGIGGTAVGGVYMHQTSSQLEESAADDAIRRQMLLRHDDELRATADRVEAIAVLLVQQGRHFEDMVRSVAPPGARLPERPAALDQIEREILRRDARRDR